MPEVKLSPGVKRLRKIVIAMGFVLVIGTLALFVAVYFKFSHRQHNAPATYIVQDKPATKCNFKATADIEILGDIINSSLSGNLLTITSATRTPPLSVNKVRSGNSLTLTANTTTPAQEIVVFDLCQGVILSRIKATPKPAI